MDMNNYIILSILTGAVGILDGIMVYDGSREYFIIFSTLKNRMLCLGEVIS